MVAARYAREPVRRNLDAVTARPRTCPSRLRRCPRAPRRSSWRRSTTPSRTNDEQTAFQIAWAAVKRKYKQADGKWVLKSGDEMTVITDIAMHETMFLDAAGSTGLVITPEG
jgi:hypothetical protein